MTFSTLSLPLYSTLSILHSMCVRSYSLAVLMKTSVKRLFVVVVVVAKGEKEAEEETIKLYSIE